MTMSSSTRKTLQIVMLQPVYAIDVTNAPFKGPKDAPVTLVVFDDYQCPYCKGVEPLLQQVLERYPKEAKLVIKQFPLSEIPQYARKVAVATLDAQGRTYALSLYLSGDSFKDELLAGFCYCSGLRGTTGSRPAIAR